MSTAIALSGNASFYSRQNGTGASDAAKKLLEFCNKNVIALRDTSVVWGWKSLLAGQLQETYSECSTAKWDGYDACPITDAAYEEALMFINVLPSAGLPFPEIVPEPEGSIGFEWHFGKNHVFVVSLKGNGIITFAGILGSLSKTRYGTENFNDSIPKFIIECIRLAEKKDRTL